MTNEERERIQRIKRNIEFIVQNQAQFDRNQAQPTPRPRPSVD
jgi:hypothetical protein